MTTLIFQVFLRSLGSPALYDLLLLITVFSLLMRLDRPRVLNRIQIRRRLQQAHILPIHMRLIRLPTSKLKDKIHREPDLEIRRPINLLNLNLQNILVQSPHLIKSTTLNLLTCLKGG